MRSITPPHDDTTTTRRALTWTIFIGAAGTVVYLCLAILHPFAGAIAWSAVLAIICYPAHQRLVEKTHRVALSAFIVSLITVVAFVMPLLLLGGVAVADGAALGHAVQNAMTRQASPATKIATTAVWLGDHLGIDGASVAAAIRQYSGDLAASAGRYAVSIVAGVLDVVLASVLVIVTLFLLLRDGDGIADRICDLLPFERRRSAALLARITDVVQASVYGVLVVALLQGMLCGVMFAVLGVPSAVLGGVVTMFASLLPVVGAFAVWGPAAVYLAVNGEWVRAVVLAVWGTLVISGIDNIVRPRLVAGRVGLSELAMLFAMLGGISVFGALGIVLGPVAFATAAAVVEILAAPQTDEAAAARSERRDVV